MSLIVMNDTQIKKKLQEKDSEKGSSQNPITSHYKNKSSYHVVAGVPDQPLKRSKTSLKQPLYIQACENKSWTLKLHKKSGEGKSWLVCYKCRSWRHAGECARARGAVDYVRIKNAITKLGDNWIYLVFTFDRSKSLENSYKNIIDCWNKFRCRFSRNFGKFSYIVLIEQHGDGYPHVNVLIKNDLFYESCRDENWKDLRKNWLDKNVMESGFGWKYWVEPMRSKEAISGYFVKLIGQMSAEFTKPSQIPISAPKGFRRLRASKGLLARAFKDYTLTGELIKASVKHLENFVNNNELVDKKIGITYRC